MEENVEEAAWLLRVGGSKRGIDVVARWADDLLLVDAPFTSHGDSDWATLEACGRFAGGAKLARLAGDDELRLRAELPLVGGRPLGPALRALRQGLLEAHAYAQTGVLPKPMRARDSDGLEGALAEASEICSAAGWSFESRPGGGVVELEVGARFEQARLLPLANGGVLLTAELTPPAVGDEPAASAQARCLLRAAGCFRLTRPAADRSADGSWRPRYEVVLPPGATAFEMGEALSALSVALLYSVQELSTLATDAAVAAVYLQDPQDPQDLREEGEHARPTNHPARNPTGSRKEREA